VRAQAVSRKRAEAAEPVARQPAPGAPVAPVVDDAPRVTSAAEPDALTRPLARAVLQRALNNAARTQPAAAAAPATVDDSAGTAQGFESDAASVYGALSHRLEQVDNRLHRLEVAAGLDAPLTRRQTERLEAQRQRQEAEHGERRAGDYMYAYQAKLDAAQRSDDDPFIAFQASATRRRHH